MDIAVHPRTGKLLADIFSTIQREQHVMHPFVLLYGEKWLGKMTLAKYYAELLLQWFVQNDLLMLQDFSSILGKSHPLRVSFTKNELSDTLYKHHSYDDKGVRQIQERLVRSPLWSYKIVIIENLERVTISWANALLKLLEEPGENRLFIATTNSLTSLLDTIRSRALLLAVQPVDDLQLNQVIQNQFPSLPKEDTSLILQLAQGRVWFALRMAQECLAEEWENILVYWKKYLQIFNEKNTLSLYKFFETLSQKWLWQDFVHLLHYDLSIKKLSYVQDLLVHTQKHISHNGNKDANFFVLARELVMSS